MSDDSKTKTLAGVLKKCELKIDTEAIENLTKASESMIKAMNAFACNFNEVINKQIELAKNAEEAKINKESMFSIDGIECGTVSTVHFVDFIDSKDCDKELLDSLKNGSVFEGRVNGRVRRNEEKLPKKLKRGW